MTAWKREAGPPLVEWGCQRNQRFPLEHHGGEARSSLKHFRLLPMASTLNSPLPTSPAASSVSSLRRYRVLVLPLAAAIIAGLVVWRMAVDGRQTGSGASTPTMVMAQNHGFMLTDQHRHLTKLQGYLGRTKLILVFFDGNTPAHSDPVVARLRDEYEKLKSAGVQPIAISTASPFAVQKSEELSGKKFPFPILMDVDPNGLIPTPAHLAWGLLDSRTETLKTGTFLIDRMGRVSAKGFVPRPVKDPQHVIDTILRGEWVEDVAEPVEQPVSPAAPGPPA